MSARLIAARLPELAQSPPLAPHFRGALRRLLRRFTSAPNSTERLLAVEDRVTLGPKKALLLVRCHGRRFLIATAGDTIGPIMEVATPKPAGRRAPKTVSRSGAKSIPMERKA
jgi:flagellar biogenesis protein FliO